MILDITKLCRRIQGSFAHFLISMRVSEASLLSSHVKAVDMVSPTRRRQQHRAGSFRREAINIMYELSLQLSTSPRSVHRAVSLSFNVAYLREDVDLEASLLG